MERTIESEVVVIGGGPAGSSAAAVLAERGRSVTVLEKSRFPRYHVGESLMPYCWYPLNRLGVIDAIEEAGFVHKHSVQFVKPDGSLSAPFYFKQHKDHPSSVTWQVYRSEFDKILLNNAAQKGAKVHLRTQARELIEEDGRVVGVKALGPDGEAFDVRASMVIDASGRDSFAQSRRGWRVRDPELSKISVWTYYKSAKRDPGDDEGATTVAYLPEKGWFWYIPLKGDVVSVGVVADREYLYRDGVKDPQTVFNREIERNEWIKDHLSVGRQVGKFWVTGDYSYRSKHCADDGLLLIGDAFAFLDPVFSSGVFLALKSGELGADAVDKALEEGNVAAEQFNDYGQTMKQGIEAMRKLVYAFYDAEFSFGHVVKNHPHVRGDLTDCLIGDLFRDFDELFAAVGEFAALPEPLDYGGAAVRVA